MSERADATAHELGLSWITTELALAGELREVGLVRLALELGVRAIVDVRHEAHDDAQLLAEHGVAFLHLPTLDHHALRPLALETGTAWVLERLSRGERVCIHCQHGIGRSVLLALCVLVRLGEEPLAALCKVKAARPRASPSPQQLHGFAGFCRAAGLLCTQLGRARRSCLRTPEGRERTMIVYGDQQRIEPVSACLTRLQRLVEVLASNAADPWRSRRCELVIESGIVAQGLLDWELEQLHCDEVSPLSVACTELCALAGRAFCTSEPCTAAISAVLSRLRALVSLEAQLSLRVPEGFAFYALYPEQYECAAQLLPDHEGPTQVIGLRSIGSSLAGVVAHTLGSRRLPWAVRPQGHPFARELRVGPALSERLLQDKERTRYVVVDEGPGLSGSSFAAVTTWLEAHGVSLERVCLLPGHAGNPGPYASEGTLAHFRACRRVCCDFEQTVLHPHSCYRPRRLMASRPRSAMSIVHVDDAALQADGHHGDGDIRPG